VLAPGMDVAFEHHADNAIVAARDLTGHIACNLDLPLMLLLAVRMRAIDHDSRSKSGTPELGTDRLDTARVVVGHAAATQDDVAILVARGAHDGRVAPLGYGQEMMRRGGRLDRVDRDLHPAVGPVLESDRARQA